MSQDPGADWTPHEGEERPATPPQPQRYEGTPAAGSPPYPATPPAAPAPVPSSPPPAIPVSKRLAAVSGPLSLILFFVCGFAFNGWAWAWIVFLLPGVVFAWARAGHDHDR